MEFNPLHLEVGWCVFHVNCKRITEQFKLTFLDLDVGKSPGKLSTEYRVFEQTPQCRSFCFPEIEIFPQVTCNVCSVLFSRLNHLTSADSETPRLKKIFELAAIQTFGSYKVNYSCYFGHNMFYL